MNGYMVSVADRVGVAASIFEAAAARGVNVFPAYGLADGTTGIILVGSDDEAGLQAAVPGHLANISYRVGRGIRWDRKNETIPGDPEAAKMLTKPYREPWHL